MFRIVRFVLPLLLHSSTTVSSCTSANVVRVMSTALMNAACKIEPMIESCHSSHTLRLETSRNLTLATSISATNARTRSGVLCGRWGSEMLGALKLMPRPRYRGTTKVSPKLWSTDSEKAQLQPNQIEETQKATGVGCQRFINRAVHQLGQLAHEPLCQIQTVYGEPLGRCS